MDTYLAQSSSDSCSDPGVNPSTVDSTALDSIEYFFRGSDDEKTRIEKQIQFFENHPWYSPARIPGLPYRAKLYCDNGRRPVCCSTSADRSSVAGACIECKFIPLGSGLCE